MPRKVTLIDTLARAFFLFSFFYTRRDRSLFFSPRAGNRKRCSRGVSPPLRVPVIIISPRTEEEARDLANSASRSARFASPRFVVEAEVLPLVLTRSAFLDRRRLTYRRPRAPVVRYLVNPDPRKIYALTRERYSRTRIHARANRETPRAIARGNADVASRRESLSPPLHPASRV